MMVAAIVSFRVVQVTLRPSWFTWLKNVIGPTRGFLVTVSADMLAFGVSLGFSGFRDI
jgi:hypothetical protein